MSAETTQSKSKTLLILSHIGIFITAGVWGSSFVSTKVLMEEGHFSPVEMYVYRFAAAYLLILLLTFKKILSHSWRDELTFFICGVCAGSLYFVTENYALANTTSGNVSLLVSISPIFTTLLVAAFYKVKLKAGVIIGSVVAFIGVACVIFSNGEGFEIHPKGDLLAIGAAAAFGVYTVLVRRLIPLYSSLFITRKLFFYGVITALPLLLIQAEPYHIGLLFDMAQPKYLLNFLFLVLICSMMAYVVWNEGMKILGSVVANNYLYFQPLFTMVLGYFIFGEEIRLLGYVGCVLVIGGLIMTDKLEIRMPKRFSRMKKYDKPLR